MADNINSIPFGKAYLGENLTYMARDLVYQQACNLGVQKEHPTFSVDEVYVVWFSYTLGNWKALCATSLPDGRYYEVTYNAEKSQAYVDTYKKTHNIAIDIVRVGEENG